MKGKPINHSASTAPIVVDGFFVMTGSDHNNNKSKNFREWFSGNENSGERERLDLEGEESKSDGTSMGAGMGKKGIPAGLQLNKVDKNKGCAEGSKEIDKPNSLSGGSELGLEILMIAREILKRTRPRRNPLANRINARRQRHGVHLQSREDQRSTPDSSVLSSLGGSRSTR
jgi:hypothetical protein